MLISFIGPIPPHPGGIAHHGSNLIRALRESHDVSVYPWNLMYPRYRRRQWGVFGTEYRESELARWWNPLSWHRVGRESRQADLIVLQYFHPVFALPLGVIARVARPAPTVAIVHNVIPHEQFPLSGPLAKWALMPTAAVVTHSQHVAADVSATASHQEVHVVPHPPNIDVTSIDPPRLPPLRLLFLGYVRRYKGLDICLKAMGLAVRQGLDLELTIAGEFWDGEDDYVRLINVEGLQRRVTMRPGYVPDAQVCEYLADHHALVAPYRTATQSGLVPVALASGRPVVATHVGGLVEQIEDGINGVLAASHEVECLAQAFWRMDAEYDELRAGTGSSQSGWEDVVLAITSAAAPMIESDGSE